MVNWTSILPPSVEGAAVPQDPELNVPTNNSIPVPVPDAGPPYLPNTALVGGIPTPTIDDPISGVLMFLFLVAAAAHMAVFQINKKKEHLFVFSAMMFAFSLIRAVALLLRIVLASHPADARLSIAANVLTQAGTILVFLINLFFAQRILRGYHPIFGWSTPARILHRIALASVVLSLLMVIITTVQSFFTLDEATREADRTVQLFGGTYLTVLAFLPIPIVVLAMLAPRKYVTEKFGTGSWRAKLFLVLFTSAIMTLGAGFRVGTNYAPRPRNDPAWYHSRGPYYAFNFILDLIVAYLYLATGFHKRFYVPNGARGPGSYMDTLPTEKVKPSHRRPQSTPDGSFQSAETLAQFKSTPSPTIRSSKMPIGYVGYNDSLSSLKAQQRKQRNRLSKTNSKQFRQSNTSIASQSTFVGSAAPSFAETAARSLPSIHRGAAGDRGSGMAFRYPDYNTAGGVDQPPPVPMLPAAAESMYGYNTSWEGTIYEELDDHRAGAVRARRSPDAVGRRQSTVLDDMLGKIDGVRNGPDDHEQPLPNGQRRSQQRRSTELTSYGLRMVGGGQDLEMSGAAGARHPQQQHLNTISDESDFGSQSSVSSRYTDQFDGFDSENSGRRPRQA